MAQYEVTLRDCWRILRRRRGGVIFTAFLLGFFSFVLAQIWQPIPEYTAEAKIQIEANQSMASLYLEYLGYSVGDEIETKISVIRSYPVLRRTAVAMGMMENAATQADTTMIVQGLEASIDVDGGLCQHSSHFGDRHQSHHGAQSGQPPRRSLQATRL